MIDDEDAYTAMESRDPRFDGWFFIGVTTTGIYCRPSCPAVMPKRENARFFPTAAAAQVNGFRACKRCRPDTAPGSPEWNARADLVGRAMRLIADGIIDREGAAGLARRLGYSERQVHRQLVAEVGAGPQALARAQRAQTARTLLETTELPVSEVAFAAGFASIRQFNDTVRQLFATTPTRLRATRAKNGIVPAPGAIVVRLAYRPPMDVPALLGFLGDRAVAGVEEYVGGVYRRSVNLAHGAATIALWEVPPGESASGAQPHLNVNCELRLDDLRDLTTAVQRCRRLLDLDADQQAIVGFLGADSLLGPLVAACPGRRIPGHLDAAELAVRVVLGRIDTTDLLVKGYGRPLPAAVGGITHTFPDVFTLAAAELADLGLSPERRRTLLALAGALADGTIELDPGADRDRVQHQLFELPGIDPRMVAHIRMRALGDPDIFVPDVDVRRALRRLGGTDREPVASDRWRPWRSYATAHLWALAGEQRP